MTRYDGSIAGPVWIDTVFRIAVRPHAWLRLFVWYTLLFPEFPDVFGKTRRMLECIIGGMNRYCDKDTRKYKAQLCNNN
jgi:hypothetical protein